MILGIWKSLLLFPNVVPETKITQTTMIPEDALPENEELKSLFSADGMQYKWEKI